MYILMPISDVFPNHQRDAVRVHIIITEGPVQQPENSNF